MKLIQVSTQNTEVRRRFFRTIFGEEKGYIAVAAKRPSSFSNYYFKYPTQLEHMLQWIDSNLEEADLYYASCLFEKASGDNEQLRKKENVKVCPNIWVDLDEVDPDTVKPPLSFTIATSPARFQGLWILDQPASPIIAEKASRKATYSNGADKGCWNLGRLLRIPLTYNNKYGDKPIVEIVDYDPTTHSIEEFLALPEDDPQYKLSDLPFPEDEIAKLKPSEVLEKHLRHIPPVAINLYYNTPDKDWSNALWALENLLLESGLSEEEAFILSETSATNKYARDGRSRVELWTEITKAKSLLDLRVKAETIDIGSLLTEEEWSRVKSLPPTIVDKYIDWGKSKSDAEPQYHEAGGFIILSALLSESVKLPTNWGTIVPNLWFCLLGDTTLTRKSTAMDMALDLLISIYEDCVLATDGSIEGIMTALSKRPNRSSIFVRDEFSGMLESMRKREYYTGMVEALAKLYDGKYQKRILRKETIEVRDPIFMMFCGGIKSRILELLDFGYITNGFVPRFIFIVAEPRFDRFRPVGPPTTETKAYSLELISEFSNLRNIFDQTVQMRIGPQTAVNKRVWNAELTPEAWERYNALESSMVKTGLDSDFPDTLTPSLDRFAKSGLKVSVLLAASRYTQEQAETKAPVVVELDDMLQAIRYLDGWKQHTVDVILNAGKAMSEKTLDRALYLIKAGKGDRASLMRAMHLTAHDTTMILDTLEQRGQITRQKAGKAGERLYPAGL